VAGIYIHIPFCKKACFYCDFHFSVSFKSKADIIESILLETKRRREFFEKEEIIETIYFGGGTPSVLTMSEIDEILGTVYEVFNVLPDAEVTFECNPDDLSLEYLKMLKLVGINRLSIGIQSFNENHLVWMNRSHTASQSLQCVHDAASVGFNNITIDLIYGVPQLDNQEWRDTVKQALALPINHLSAYSLTMEENTPYKKLVQQKKYKQPDEDQSSIHYEILIQEMNSAKWEHYEVSNFCKQGNSSKHNTGYWQQKKYLGIGPSAHSFDLENRSWNVSNNAQYLERIASNKKTFETELLTLQDRLNETLLTGLRAKWGINLAELKEDYAYDILTRFKEEIGYWQSTNWAQLEGDVLRLTDQGLLFADYIASELFADEDYSSQTSS
jgi:oxygen-independent coproporphyrinogen-3 oxidase